MAYLGQLTRRERRDQLPLRHRSGPQIGVEAALREDKDDAESLLPGVFQPDPLALWDEEQGTRGHGPALRAQGGHTHPLEEQLDLIGVGVVVHRDRFARR